MTLGVENIAPTKFPPTEAIIPNIRITTPVDPSNTSALSRSGPSLPSGSGVNVRSASTIVGSVAYHYSKNISIQFYIVPPIAYEVDAAGSLDGVGIGLNYTTFLSESPTPLLNGAFGGETDIKSDDSFGVALQAGLGTLDPVNSSSLTQ